MNLHKNIFFQTSNPYQRPYRQSWNRFILFLDQIQMRNQIQKLKRLQIHAHVNMASLPQDTNRDSPSPYTDHKSICYIQLTDFSETNKTDEKASFRNTLYTKIGKRISPKKNFFKTMVGKFEGISSQQRTNVRKTDRGGDKTSSIARQYSQRSSFIIKKLNQCSRLNNRDISQILFEEKNRVLKTEDNQQSLFEDIERLRYSENGYLQMLKDKALLSNTSVVNLQIDHQQQAHTTMAASNPDLIDAEIIRQNREEAALRLKEKIKNKQSRRHIYHSLRNKCEAWNKIRLKTQHHLKTEGVSATKIITKTQESSVQRLHCKQISRNPRSIQAVIAKHQIKPTFDGSNPLKIISKPCAISLNTYTSFPDSPIKKMSTSFYGNPENMQPSASKIKSKKDIYDQIILNIAKNKKQSPLGKNQNSEQSNKNQFRLLTPWQAQSDEPF